MPNNNLSMEVFVRSKTRKKMKLWFLVVIKKFKVNLVAEVGCNHMGDLSIAKKMIEVIAKFCEVKHVKFQKRDVKKILSKSEYNKPHPVPENSFGKTYGEHRDFLEFNIEKHKKLKKNYKKNKINYSSSAWDLESAKILNKLGLKYIKIPSASNCDFEMLNYLCDNFKGGIHVSLGMTSRKEEKFLIFLKKEELKI